MIVTGNVFDLFFLVISIALIGASIFNILKLPKPKEFAVLAVFE